VKKEKAKEEFKKGKNEAEIANLVSILFLQRSLGTFGRGGGRRRSEIEGRKGTG
jgi:hypothetical protein